MTDRIGQQFGNYRLVTLLGHGGFAEVYLGQHVRLPLQVAIKVLHANLTGSEIEHFQHEAETIARLAHPSIVRVLDYDVQEGVPFLVMDYAINGSLRQRYPKGSLVPLPIIISSVKQVSDALHYAHEEKFIHRDVKPENMLQGHRQEVLLSDFGIATIAHNTSSINSSAEGTSGTLAYMAPEQIEGHPRPASDQYALGVVVYEWLCGERPFEGSASEVIAQQLSVPPLPLHERVPTISDEIEQVVLKALAKDPRHRFTSVQDFALALEAACRTDVSSGHTHFALTSASPAQNPHTSKHNLPASLTPLLGREQDVSTVCTLLRRPEVRLVTLTGTGGVGKTRLATAVATEVLADFPDGVFLVSLAPISDPALVIPSIAQVLDVIESGAMPLPDLLTAFLRDKHLLLCLDNFEQILPAAPYLTELLERCPHLNLLVTSRAVLHIQGEHEVSVLPLAVPDLTQLPPADTLHEYAAVALFLQRAEAVQPTFKVTSSNARCIAEISVRLDGLPLAIELAAARLKLLSPQVLLARLGQRFGLLTSGVRDAPARQQTLRQTIAWSYNLLDATEQRLFRRISVFVGGCRLEVVEDVCAALDSEALGVVDGVSSLIDKSLLQSIEQESQELRLVMLETIREYALEALAASGEMEETRQAHAACYLRLAEEAEQELVGPLQSEWLERLEREHENLRAALSWLLEQAESEGDRSSQEMALRLSAALRKFWDARGHASEGRAFLERALVVSEGTVTTHRLKALKGAASMAVYYDDLERGEPLCKEILILSRELEDRDGIAHTLYVRGIIAGRRNDPATARARLEEALAIWRELDDKEGIAWALFFLTMQFGRMGDFAKARALCEECLTLKRELGDTRGIAYALWQLALILMATQGDQGVVCALLEESLALAREIGDRRNMARCISLLAEVSLKQGDIISARTSAEQSLGFSKEIGDQESIAEALSLLGKVNFVLGDYTVARALFEESMAFPFGVHPLSLEELASVVAAQGEPMWAAQLWGAAEALRESLGTPMPPVMRADYEHSVATARTQLGEKAFVAAWEEGRSMTAEQALAAQGRTLAPPAKSPIIYPAGLTAREVEVLCLVALGMTNEQVAKQLIISPRTVNTHLTAIYGKIKVTSRNAATRYALEHQLV